MTRRLRKHGLSRTPEYRAWQQMVRRCTNPKHVQYADYGGRGIAVCERWVDDPAAFFADIGPKPTPDHELDRTDNDGGYCPENCRWVSRIESANNRRSVVNLTIDGCTMSVARWAAACGLAPSTVYWRLAAGWHPADAVGTDPAEYRG